MSTISASTQEPRLHTDTPPEIEAFQIQQLRQMPEWRKMALMADMIQSVRSLALAGLRQRLPDATPEQLRRHLADLVLGSELATRVYGPLPEADPCQANPSR